jgi:hypothetical protein
MTTDFKFDDPMIVLRDGEGVKLYWEIFSAGIPRPNEGVRRIQLRPVPRAPLTSLRELFAQPTPTLAEDLLATRARDGDGCADRLEEIYLREGIPARELLLPHVQQALRLLARSMARADVQEISDADR